MLSPQQPTRQTARLVLLAVLLTANVLLYAAWPWLREMPLMADSSERFVLSNAVRNDDYLAEFFGAIRQKEKIFFLGTSESTHGYNLGAQLNSFSRNGSQIVVFAHAGISPIHSALVVARAKRDGVKIPPVILVINPVYFTKAYDIIDDGWMTHTLRSPVFLQMNHRNVMKYLSKDVQQAYETHFALGRWLYPAKIQEYLGNLLYLRFHQPVTGSNKEAPLPTPTYTFDGKLPDYDEEQNIWAGVEAVDRFSKDRWAVSSVNESLNLKGMASILAILQSDSIPVLVLLLPANRKFYEHHGLDMAEFDRGYRDIRGRLENLSQGENVYLIDLYDSPRLRFGFKDRMHMDQFGFSQLASYIAKHEIYLRFLVASKDYYDLHPKAPKSPTSANLPTGRLLTPH